MFLKSLRRNLLESIRWSCYNLQRSLWLFCGELVEENPGLGVGNQFCFDILSLLVVPCYPRANLSEESWVKAISLHRLLSLFPIIKAY